MTNIDRAVRVLHESLDRIWGYDAPDWADDIAADLRDAGIITPEPRIIRTREELAALDPSTAVTNGPMIQAAVTAVPFHEIGLFTLPAAVIATGDQVRAARQALEATE